MSKLSIFKGKIKKQILPIALLFLVLGLAFSNELSGGLKPQPFSSVEVRLAEQSPRGLAGGAIVPASCPSYSHLGDNCNAEEGDMCFNIGGWQDPPPDGYTLYETPGVYRLCCASGYVPSDPYTCVPACAAGTGLACASAANSCGQTRANGTMQCNGTCTSTPPPLSDCPPTVTITPPGGTPATTANVVTGQTATITWSCPSSGNTSASGVNFTTGGAVSGSTGVTVTTDKTYTVVCDQTGSQASVSVIAINANMSITASPSRVRLNDTSVITWSASGVNSCSLVGPGTTDAATAVSGSISSRNKTTAAITGQSTYTLTCETDATPISTSVNVLLIPNTIEI